MTTRIRIGNHVVISFAKDSTETVFASVVIPVEDVVVQGLETVHIRPILHLLRPSILQYLRGLHPGATLTARNQFIILGDPDLRLK